MAVAKTWHKLGLDSPSTIDVISDRTPEDRTGQPACRLELLSPEDRGWGRGVKPRPMMDHDRFRIDQILSHHCDHAIADVNADKPRRGHSMEIRSATMEKGPIRKRKQSVTHGRLAITRHAS
jgi:hypothetical protein